MTPADRKRRGYACVMLCLLLVGSIGAVHAAPRVDVVSANLGPLIDAAARSPSRFAVDIPHPASPSTDGEWSISGATSTWTYTVQIPGAVSMSFHATRASLPTSATLTVVADATRYVYTSKDANGGDLWSRIGRGDSLVFELSVATTDVDDVQLDIGSLQAGFRAFDAGMSNHPRYDDLRMRALITLDVLPPCADNWTCEVTPTNEGPGNATVALVIGNVGQCSGVLLNDVPGDGIPYVLTARHCENGDPNGGTPSAAASVTVYWNAISACGTTLGKIYDPDIITQYGAQTVVEQQDAWLIRLRQLPVAAVDAYYAGWDATGATFVGGFTAHHAIGSSRQYIGWFGQAAYLTVPAAALGVKYDSTFWGTVNAVGAGGPGASGAGVFDATGRLVSTVVRGLQSDGMAVCPAASPPAPSLETATTLSTALSGIFDSTADPASTTGSVTLRSVLDPGNTGTKVTSGKKKPITVIFNYPEGYGQTGQQGELSWSASAGATSCTATGGEPGDGWAGPVPPAGAKTVTSYDGGDVTYTLTCTDGQRTGTGSAVWHWTLATPVVQLFGFGQAEYGVPYGLDWSSNVRPCTATGGTAGDGWAGSRVASVATSSTTVSEDVVGPVTYVLTCGSGTRVAAAQFMVNVPAPAVSLQADAVTLRTGQSVTISAYHTGSPCAKTGGTAGDGWAGSSNNGTTISELVPGSYTYVMACGSGSHVATGQVTVTFVNAPAAVSLQSSSASGTVNVDWITLSWDANVRPCQLTSTGPTTRYLQTGPLTPDSSWTVQQTVIGRYDYTVTCGLGGDAVHATATVNWTGVPSVQLSAPNGAARGSLFDVDLSSNVVPCIASGGTPGGSWAGRQFDDGFAVVQIVEQTAGTKTYTITCGSGPQTVTASANVNVVEPPHVTLTADKSGQLNGASVTLTWSSNVSPCVLSGGRPGDGWRGTFGSSGSVTVTETSSGTFSFMFGIECGTYPLSATATAYVTYADVAAPMLTASKTRVVVGDNVTLTWASVDGSTCTALGGLGTPGWSDPLSPSGSFNFSAWRDGTFTFGVICGRSLPATVDIQVDPKPAPLPPTVRLTASAAAVQIGDPFTLTWTVSNAQNCNANGGGSGDGWTGALATNGGSMAIHEALDAHYTYIINCYSAFGLSASATADVVVNRQMATSSPSPSDGASSSSGGGGGAMGPIDVAFFLAAALAGLLRRRRLGERRVCRAVMPSPVGCAALFVCVCLLGAVEPSDAAPTQQDCHLKQIASLDLVVRKGILVPVTLDGHAGYMELILASALSAFYQGTVDPIGLQHRNVNHTGLYWQGEQIKQTAKFGSLSLGKANFGNGEFVLLSVEDKDKGDIFGMLGMRFFSHLDFELDLAHKKMNLFAQDHCPEQVVYWSDSFASVPLKTAPLGELFFEIELENKKVAASWSPSSSTTTLTTDASRRLFGFDETSQGIETDANGIGHYRAMRLTAPGLSATNVKIALVPSQDGRCGKAPATGSHVSRNNSCLEVPPLILGRNVLEALRLYFATKERVLYFTEAGSSN